MEFVNCQAVKKQLCREEVVWRTYWRRAGLQPRITGNDGEIAAANVKGNALHCRRSGIHLGFVERPGAYALKRRTSAEGEQIGRHI